MKTSDTTTKGTSEVPSPLNTVGGELESSFGEALPSRLQDTAQERVTIILSDVSGALPPEELTGAKEQAREFQEKMELFVQEVERVRVGFGFDFNNSSDYIDRLATSTGKINEVFERILSESKGLGKAYNEVIGCFSGNRELLKKELIRKYGEDLAYEGIKTEERTERKANQDLDFSGKNARAVRKMVVGFAEFGGKGLNLWGNGLNEVFAGKPEMFKLMVVEYAKAGGKSLNIGSNRLDELFVGKAILLKKMVVEFAKNGGRRLILGDNGLDGLFINNLELFEEMMVEYTKANGKELGLSANGLDKLSKTSPDIFKSMVIEYLIYSGRLMDLWVLGLEWFLKQHPTFIDEIRDCIEKHGIKISDLDAIYLRKIDQS